MIFHGTTRTDKSSRSVCYMRSCCCTQHARALRSGVLVLVALQSLAHVSTEVFGRSGPGAAQSNAWATPLPGFDIAPPGHLQQPMLLAYQNLPFVGDAQDDHEPATSPAEAQAGFLGPRNVDHDQPAAAIAEPRGEQQGNNLGGPEDQVAPAADQRGAAGETPGGQRHERNLFQRGVSASSKSTAANEAEASLYFPPGRQRLLLVDEDTGQIVALLRDSTTMFCCMGATKTASMSSQKESFAPRGSGCGSFCRGMARRRARAASS
ncbi:unnamed protein product [Amoebophrya sp. A120]|nr:unnamed protein product [Amoebophrya sp. A120]|eukprot:GSA120T00023057001.1